MADVKLNCLYYTGKLETVCIQIKVLVLHSNT